MVKYLTKKGLTFWYRRRIGTKEEIVFSLATKNYDLAMLRHSYIDYKINQLIIKGIFDTMDTAKIRDIIDGYKEFIKSDEFIYGDEGEARGKELALEIDGEFFGGHTKTALLHKLTEYGKISQTDDIQKVKAHTEPIIERNNTLKRKLDKLEDDKERDYFHWKLLKAEVWGLNKAIKQQDKYFGAVEQQQVALTTAQPIRTNGNTISIDKLTKKYIEEKSKTKEWGAKNEKDIKFVLGLLDEYFSPKTANQLTRNDFVEFRDDVLPKLPVRMGQNAFKNKGIKEIIKMKYILTDDEKKEIGRIGKTTINKHIGRVNQVYAWAADEAGILEKNFCSKLRYAKPKTAEEKKKAKAMFNTDDLKRWFEVSPHFTSELKQTLTDKPEHIFIPLLALYLGARNAELTQLHYRDIKEIKGIWCITITGFSPDNTERKKVKGENSLRTIPVAQGLIDIRFLKYVEKRKNKLLFPKIKYTSDQEPLFTNEINLYIREHIRQGEERKTFMSFRHMVNQNLKNKGAELYIINDITGHSDRDHGDNNIDVDTYGDEQMPLQILQEVINRSLVYDEIDFSHIKEEIHRRYK